MGRTSNVNSCAGFRTPGSREPPQDKVAGGRKPPRHEVAGKLGTGRAATAMGFDAGAHLDGMTERHQETQDGNEARRQIP